jgi:hypothetical protein
VSEQGETRTDRVVFPPIANYLLPLLIVGLLGGGPYVFALAGVGLTAEALNKGYKPEQPVPFSHALHAGELQMDCRYCHSTVERESFAAVPPTQTCMNCHSNIKGESEKLELVRASAESGEPIPWVKVHDLADYAYFNHSQHVNNGIGCVSCHGRVDRMEEVQQVEALSMGWCLDCHRNPEPHLRPLDRITDMDWKPPTGEARAAQIQRIKKKVGIPDEAYMTSCSLCHR